MVKQFEITVKILVSVDGDGGDAMLSANEIGARYAELAMGDTNIKADEVVSVDVKPAQSLTISKYADGISVVKVERTDFWCRIWEHHQEFFHELLRGERDEFSTTECIFDVFGHYCDVVFRYVGGKITVSCIEYDDQGTIFEGEFELSGDQIEHLKLIGR